MNLSLNLSSWSFNETSLKMESAHEALFEMTVIIRAVSK